MVPTEPAAESPTPRPLVPTSTIPALPTATATVIQPTTVPPATPTPADVPKLSAADVRSLLSSLVLPNGTTFVACVEQTARVPYQFAGPVSYLGKGLWFMRASPAPGTVTAYFDETTFTPRLGTVPERC
jgi:hypothetical protein